MYCYLNTNARGRTPCCHDGLVIEQDDPERSLKLEVLRNVCGQPVRFCYWLIIHKVYRTLSFFEQVHQATREMRIKVELLVESPHNYDSLVGTEVIYLLH